MRYSSSRIQQDARLFSVDYLIHMVEIGRLDPRPNEDSLTRLSLVKKSQIVESLILGLPTETIWAEQDPIGETLLLSGFDIIACIMDFRRDYLILSGLRVLKHLEGMRFSDIGYAEQKHFMQMEVGFTVIHHESDPILKCLFVESIHRSKHGNNAPQIARKIIFKKASIYLENQTDNLMSVFDHYSIGIGRKKYDELFLMLQAEILICLLFIHIDLRKHNIRHEYIHESYSYSRSHISPYSNLENVELNYNDSLENSMNKLMFILETDCSRISEEIETLEKILRRVRKKTNSLNLKSIGKNWFYTSKEAYELRMNKPSILELVLSEISIGLKPNLRMSTSTSVKELMDYL